MKKVLFAVWCFAGVFGVRAEEAVPLTVVSDRPGAIYRKGETAGFRISVNEKGRPVEDRLAIWVILKNGLAPVASGTIPLQNGEATVSAKLDEPGFLLCQVRLSGEEKPGLGGVAFDPLEIQPSAETPPDFDLFWQEQLTRLQKVPKKFHLTPVPSPQADLATFDLLADCVDAPVSGYFARPADAEKGRLPAILLLHGAGVGSGRLETAANWARKGFLALDINAHGLPNGKPDAFYNDLAAGDLKDYPMRGREKGETVYFRGMFLRVVRALDFLTSQPEWDGRTLVVFGSSQGAAQALAGAALDDRVSFAVAGVPAMCDHTGPLAGRDSGWPKFFLSHAPPDPAVQKAVSYFDMVSFASRIKVPVFFTVGFLDQTCPPATVYAAYNQLGGEKSIFNDIVTGHTNSPDAKRLMRDAVLDHVAKQKTP